MSDSFRLSVYLYNKTIYDRNWSNCVDFNTDDTLNNKYGNSDWSHFTQHYDTQLNHIQHNNIQHNDTQYKRLICDTQHK